MGQLRRLNFPILFLSFGLALILWTNVVALRQEEQSVTGAFTLPVETRNLPGGYVVLGSIPSSATFTAEGNRDERTKIDPKNLKAYIDLSKPNRSGKYVIRLDAPTEYVVSWNPKEILTQVHLEKEVQSDPLPVTVEAIGQFKLQNFRYDGATAEPSTIIVTGAESLLKKVDKVRAYLNLSDLESQSSVRASIELIDKNGAPVQGVRPSTDTVVIRAIIAARPPRRSLLIQPVWQGSPEFGTTIADYQFTPAQVSVEGPADVLANLSVINTKPINIEGLNQTTTLQAELDLPLGVRLTNPSPISVKVFVKSSGNSPNQPGNSNSQGNP